MITPRYLRHGSALILAAALVVGCSTSAPAPSASPAPTAQIIILVATPTPGSAPDPVEALEAGRIAVYDRVAPAVVNVTTQVLRPTFSWSVVPEEGSGSGFLLYLVGGDILTAIDDRPLRTWDDPDAYLDEQTEVGQTVRLSVIRDGEPQELTATLQDTPDSLQ